MPDDWQHVADAAAPTVAAVLAAFPGACVSDIRRPVIHDWRWEHDPEEWPRVIKWNLGAYAAALRVAAPEDKDAIRDVLGYWKAESARLALEQMPDPDEEPARGFVQRLRKEMRAQGTAFRLSEKQAGWLRQIVSDWRRYGASDDAVIEDGE